MPALRPSGSQTVMVSFVVQRLLGMFAVMAILVTIVFVIVRVAPGDPAAVMSGADASVAEVQAMRARLGIDRSLPEQYLGFLAQLARGDLGQSLFLGRPVLTALAERAEPTFFLSLFAMAISCVIALPVGILAAYRRGSMFDQAATAMAMLAASIPSFWLALLLIQWLAVHVGLFPVSGYGPPGAPFAERMSHLVLPAIVLGIINSALIVRFTRASMLDVLGDDYVRTARSKGMSEARVVLRHALRNAMIPILTVVGLTAALLVSGAVVTETVFALPGVGNLVVNAVLRRDYPVIQGALMVVAALYVLINFAIDMLYVMVDPRVRYR